MTSRRVRPVWLVAVWLVAVWLVAVWLVPVLRLPLTDDLIAPPPNFGLLDPFSRPNYRALH
ncbi:MAG: hypothetical protein WCB44_05550, partial [Stellaceae bacterium]